MNEYRVILLSIELEIISYMFKKEKEFFFHKKK